MILGKGINLGGWLSQCDHSPNRYENFVTESDFRRISGEKFDHVRVPFDYELLEKDSGEATPANFEFLDRAVGWGKRYGLNVILDLHKAFGYDFNDFGKEGKNTLFENAASQERFLALWDKVSARYASATNVAFELLNEVTDVRFIDPWNDLICRAVETIRKNAADAPIIYGGVCWNSAKYVKNLVSPPAPGIIYTFHLYEPLLFTHQKASWVEALKDIPSVPYPADMEFYREKSKPLGFMGENLFASAAKNMGEEFFEDFLREAFDYAKSQNVPLYCGEFGVIDQAPADNTVKWFRDVLSVFKKLGIGSALWNYREMDFGWTGSHYEKLRDFLARS